MPKKWVNETDPWRSLAAALFVTLCMFCETVGQQTRSPELVIQAGHAQTVNSVAFSPDGKLLASASDDGKVKLWQVDTQTEIRTFTARFSVNSVAFHPSESIVAGADGENIKLWNILSGDEIRTISGHLEVINSIAFSPDGTVIASASADNTVKLWNAGTGAEIRTLRGHTDNVTCVVFSPDRSTLASSSSDGTVRMWNAQSGELLRTLGGTLGYVEAVAFANEGKLVAGGGRFWDTATGTEIKYLPGGSANGPISFSREGQMIAIGGVNKIALWITGTNPAATPLTLAGTVLLRSAEIKSVAFSPDGKILASGSADKTVRFWDLTHAAEGKVDILKVSSPNIAGHTAEFSRDFSAMALFGAGYNNTIALWDLKNGMRLPDLVGSGHQIGAVAFHPARPLIAGYDWHNNLLLWDKNNGRQLKIKNDPAIKIGLTGSLRFSNDGNTLLIRYIDGTCLFWDYEMDKLEVTVVDKKLEEIITKNYPREGFAELLAFRGIVKTDNARVTLFHPTTKKEIVSLITLVGNDWLVTTPDGFFDGTPNAWRRMIWRFENDTFNYAPVESFFSEFFRPELLKDLMSDKTPDTPKRQLQEIDIRLPQVKLISGGANGFAIRHYGRPGELDKPVESRDVEVAIEVTENNLAKRIAKHPDGAGAKDLRLFRGGSLVKHWPGDVFAGNNGCQNVQVKPGAPKQAICRATIPITAGSNVLSAYAFNSQDVKSSDSTANIIGADTLKRKGKLRIFAVGINQYANENHNLKYAVSDAVDFGNELRARQIDLNNYDTPQVVSLTDAQATKKNILYVLDRFAKGANAAKPAGIPDDMISKLAAVEKVEPEDVVVIYFAGHGTAAKDRFYLIPHEGFPLFPADNVARIAYIQDNGISDLELEEALRPVDSGQMIMVIDACNSGQALEAEEKRRGPMNSKGLAQLAYEKGMYILTAAQSVQAALEVTRTRAGKKIEHGLLTYSLLEGFTAPAADADSNKQLIDREWLNFAVHQVPQMQLEIMQARDADVKSGKRDIGVFFVGEPNKNTAPEQRGLQTPRVFYRRESVSNPFIVARP